MSPSNWPVKCVRASWATTVLVMTGKAAESVSICLTGSLRNLVLVAGEKAQSPKEGRKGQTEKADDQVGTRRTSPKLGDVERWLNPVTYHTRAFDDR